MISRPFSRSAIFPVTRGTDLHGTVLCGGNLLCPADRFIEVLAFKQGVPAHLLVRFGEGTIGNQRLAIPNAHGRRRAGGVKSAVREQHTGGFCVRHIGIPFLSDNS